MKLKELLCNRDFIEFYRKYSTSPQYFYGIKETLSDFGVDLQKRLPIYKMYKKGYIQKIIYHNRLNKFMTLDDISGLSYNIKGERIKNNDPLHQFMSGFGLILRAGSKFCKENNKAKFKYCIGDDKTIYPTVSFNKTETGISVKIRPQFGGNRYSLMVIVRQFEKALEHMSVVKKLTTMVSNDGSKTYSIDLDYSKINSGVPETTGTDQTAHNKDQKIPNTKLFLINQISLTDIEIREKQEQIKELEKMVNKIAELNSDIQSLNNEINLLKRLYLIYEESTKSGHGK